MIKPLSSKEICCFAGDLILILSEDHIEKHEGAIEMILPFIVPVITQVPSSENGKNFIENYTDPLIKILNFSGQTIYEQESIISREKESMKSICLITNANEGMKIDNLSYISIINLDCVRFYNNNDSNFSKNIINVSEFKKFISEKGDINAKQCVFRMTKQRLSISLRKYWKEVIFKLVLIILCGLCFSSHCTDIPIHSPITNYTELKKFIEDDQNENGEKIIDLTHEELDLKFCAVFESIMMCGYDQNTQKRDSCDSSIRKYFLTFNQRISLINIFINIMCTIQTLIDYFDPYNIYIDSRGFPKRMEFDFYSSVQYLLSLFLSNIIEQTFYIIPLLCFIYYKARHFLLLTDMIFFFFSSFSSQAFSIFCGSFFDRKKLFCFLMVLNVYTNMISYRSVCDLFSIIAKKYRRNFLTKFLSCYFILLPSKNLQCYIFHKNIHEQYEKIAGKSIEKSQCWGAVVTKYQKLWILIPLSALYYLMFMIIGCGNFLYRMKLKREDRA